MINYKDIYAATNSGLDILYYYLPQARGLAGTKKKFKARLDERTPSAVIELVNGIWSVIDYGGEGKPESPIDICMKEEGIKFFYVAVLTLAARYNVCDQLNYSTNKPRIEKRPAGKGEENGSRFFNLLHKIPANHRDILVPGISEEVLDEYGWFEAEFIAYVKDGEATIKYSTENYPIFMRRCVLEDGKAFYKVYEPLNPEKQWRFSYTPEGMKPKGYINGLSELQAIVRRNAHENENTDADNRVDEVYICSGERDAMCCRAMGYIPVWFNSETYDISDKEMSTLLKYAKCVYNIPDIDETGIRRGKALALKFKNLRTIWLPAAIRGFKDNRGKPRKDLRDWYVMYRSKEEFGKLRNDAPYTKFWDETFNEKSKKVECSISLVRVYYFLELHGFHVLSDPDSNETRFVHINGNIVNEIKPSYIRRFMRNWAEENHLSESVKNVIYGTKKLAESSLENLKEVELDFENFTPYSQFFFFRNRLVEVSAEDIKEQPINACQSNKFVWEKDVLKFNFRKLDDMFTIARSDDPKSFDISILNCTQSCLFGFLINSSRIHWRKEMEYRFNGDSFASAEYAATHKFCIDGEGLTAEEIAEQKQNLINKIFAIGYIAHRYKSPSRAWAPQAMDGRIGENGECNGRSGKSFLFKVMSKFMSTIKLSGRSPKLMENSHVFDRVNKSTDLVIIDDCSRTLTVDYFYDYITHDMEVNPKNNKSFSIPFESSPKFAFTTNYVPDNFDPSSAARLLYMVFSDYYHQESESNDYIETRSIRDDFGRDLFTKTYPIEDWNADINFIMQCLKFYLSVSEAGIKPLPPMENILYRKHKQDMGENFEDWAYIYFGESSGNLDRFIVRTEAFEAYRKQSNMTSLTMRGFTNKLKAFCAIAPHIEQLNPPELCKNGRILQRTEHGTTEMIYLKSRKPKNSADDKDFLLFEKDV